jgi:transcriptional regulator with XRE-family HTH domain
VNGEWLIQARKQLGLTQAQLAADLGLSRPFFNKMENGSKHIDIRTELSVRYLLGVKND